jgi:hypothetical protein
LLRWSQRHRMQDQYYFYNKVPVQPYLGSFP